MAKLRYKRQESSSGIMNFEKRKKRKSGAMYYWILTTVKGKATLLGCKGSYYEAEEDARKHTDGDYEIIPLRTVDENRATHMIKRRRMEDDHGGMTLEETMENLRHRGKDIGIE